MKNGDITCLIAPSIEIFNKTELETPNELENMLEFLQSIANELPFEVIFDNGYENIIKKFGNPK